MQGQWLHEVAYYRCRYPEQYALANGIDHLRNVYFREDQVLGELDKWLGALFAPDQIDTMVTALLAAADSDGGSVRRAEKALVEIAGVNAEVNQFRRALEQGADVEMVTGWLNEALEDKRRAERDLANARQRTGRTLGADDLRAALQHYARAAARLPHVGAERKAEIYQELGIRLNYNPHQ